MANVEHTPIERHEALAPLSRDHYVGLVQARHLKTAAEADDVSRRKAIAAFVDAWDTEIAEHFADEQLLLADLMTADDRERLLSEHRQIRELVQRARELRHQTDPPAEVVRTIGQTLEQHIRWEERGLFVRLQDQLTQGQLVELERRTASIEQARPRNACRRGGETQGGEST